MASRGRRPPRGRRAARLAAFAALVALICYFGVGLGRQIKADRDFRPIRVPTPIAAPAAIAAVLAALPSPPAAPTVPPAAPMPSAAGVTAALAAGLASAALGPNPAAVVLDAASATMLLTRRSSEALAPASTAKLILAAAVLTVYKSTDRFTTSVVAGPQPGSVVLVGGGDPSLTSAAEGATPAYPGAARISELAAQLKRSGPPTTQVLVDGSLFVGPMTAAGWGTGDAPSEYASPITAAMVDGGRDSPTAQVRSASPDLAAGRALAAALGASVLGLGSAPAQAKVLASVRSAPVGLLVEQMLRSSDDVIAEVLARQVAIAAKQPPSFTGAAAAVAATMAKLGVDVGTALRDGSGLSTQDRLTATALAQVLQLAVSPAHPELHAIATDLPVAAWDGTLSDRYTGPTSAGRGVVRAKTGTLGDQGVSTEAGTVTDASGRQLIFVFMANGAPDVGTSRTALDALASTLAQCGCP